MKGAEIMPEEKKKHPGGRPRKFKSAKEMQQAIDNYFESCYSMQYVRDGKGNILFDENEHPLKEKVQVEPFTITGLALALDTNRQGLLNYQNLYEPEFFDTILRAKAKIENYAEKQLFLAKSANGPAFNLKNNYGWVDRQEVEQNTSGKVEVVFSNELENWSK